MELFNIIGIVVMSVLFVALIIAIKKEGEQ